MNREIHIIKLESLREPGPGLYYHLTDPQLRSKQEPEKGVFIAEGPKVVHFALKCGLKPLSLLMRQKFTEAAPGLEIIRLCPGIPVYTAEDSVLEELTGFRLQRSWVLCAMKRPSPLPVAEALQNARRAAVLEGITEPSNAGAIFRSAAALGVDAVLLTPDCCDPLHRRSVRVCMGAVFRIPWARTGEDLGFKELQKAGFRTFGMALQPGGFTLDDPALASENRIALFLGNEDSGLSEKVLHQCDGTVRIPMARGIDSLNVAAAAAVAFWQLRPR